MTHFATKIFIEMYDNVYFDDVEMKTLEEMEKFWHCPRWHLHYTSTEETTYRRP